MPRGKFRGKDHLSKQSWKQLEECFVCLQNNWRPKGWHLIMITMITGHFYSATWSTTTQRRSWPQHRYWIGVSRRSAYVRPLIHLSIHPSSHDPPVERRRLYPCATTPHDTWGRSPSIDSKTLPLSCPVPYYVLCGCHIHDCNEQFVEWAENYLQTEKLTKVLIV